jgi:hypothetical protein
MKLHEFEELWLRRDELDDELRREMEDLVKRDRDCRAYAQSGWRVRRVFRTIEGSRAADGFSYRMRVYAQNHPDENEPLRNERYGWLRWPALTGGLVAGALLVVVAFGPIGQQGGERNSSPVQASDVRASGAASSAQTDEGANAAAARDRLDEQNLAERGGNPAAADTSAAAGNGDAGPRVPERLPEWQFRTVGGSQGGE